MRIETDKEVSLFVKDRDTGHLVFNMKAIKGLGLRPKELAQRGYQLASEIDSPAIAPVQRPGVAE